LAVRRSATGARVPAIDKIYPDDMQIL